MSKAEALKHLLDQIPDPDTAIAMYSTRHDHYLWLFDLEWNVCTNCGEQLVGLKDERGEQVTDDDLDPLFCCDHDDGCITRLAKALREKK